MFGSEATGFVRGTLIMTLRWINNLVKKYGDEAVMDCLPNDTGGRVWIRAALMLLGATEEEVSYEKD